MSAQLVGIFFSSFAILLLITRTFSRKYNTLCLLLHTTKHSCDLTAAQNDLFSSARINKSCSGQLSWRHGESDFRHLKKLRAKFFRSNRNILLNRNKFRILCVALQEKKKSAQLWFSSFFSSKSCCNKL